MEGGEGGVHPVDLNALANSLYNLLKHFRAKDKKPLLMLAQVRFWQIFV